jgi:hypothetical protein
MARLLATLFVCVEVCNFIEQGFACELPALLKLVILGVSFFFICLVILPFWLPTFLYVHLSLSTKITAKEADKIKFLFDGSLGGVWFPLKHIRKIDPALRREALFSFANGVAEEKNIPLPFPA